MRTKHDETLFGRRYCLAQSYKMVRVFKEATGRDVRTVDELRRWWAENQPAGKVTPDEPDLESVQQSD